MGGVRRFLARIFGGEDRSRVPTSPESGAQSLAARPAPESADGWQDEARQLADLGH
jgi:hypothetical protein